MLQRFFDPALVFLAKINEFGAQYKLNSRASPDHIGYKCGSTEEFEKLRTLVEKESEFLYQSFISNRRIAYFKLKTPLVTSWGNIHYLELSDQKPDGSQVSGFDHVEMIPLRETAESLVEYFESVGVMFEKNARPHHTTYDLVLIENFKLKIEPNRLVDKIKEEEMV